MRIISESGFYKLIARSRKATTPGTFAHRFSNWVFRNVIPGIRKTGTYGIPWGALQDFSRRKEQYQISASEKGRELQACKSAKSVSWRKKKNAGYVNISLIFTLVTAFSDKTKATAKGSPVGTRENKASPTMPHLRLVGNVISQIWFVPRFATRAFSCAL